MDTHTHTLTKVPQTSNFIKCSCEQSRIKGNMWSRAVVLQRRSGPDGFSLSDRSAHLCHHIRLSYVTVYIAPAARLIVSPLFWPFVLFYGFPVLANPNSNHRGDMQQKRRTGSGSYRACGLCNLASSHQDVRLCF